MITVKVHRIEGNVTVVTHADLAYIMRSDDVQARRVGDTLEISEAAFARSSPYGIDMSVVYPDGLLLDLEDFQKRLVNEQKIVSLAELKRNPSAINAVLLSMVGGLSASIYNQIKMAMEDLNV